MAKFSAISEGEIREGLLCPICMYDLKTVDQLQEHFEVAHATEDRAVIQSLKGFFDKAKRKILKQDNLENDFGRQPFETDSNSLKNLYVKVESIDASQEPQYIGSITTHTDYFKKVREKKIHRYNIEKNIILIRLGKLICDISSDPEKRKEYEKSIVPWVKDSDVPLCPGCAKSFGISRRRHHCRLCGYVMCNSCSFYITHDFARKLTLPAISDDQSLLQKQQQQQQPVSRRTSNVSLMSVVHMGSENHQLRICKECNLLLQRHDKLVELRNHCPVVVQIYEKLREYMSEVEKLVPVYMEMIDSLNSGETDYKLQDVQELKIKITKLAERIDNHSKHILKLESSEEEASNLSSKLHSGIRMAASQFVRNVVLSLPNAPTEKEIAKYQSMRLDQVHRRIQQEKEAEKLQNLKSSKSPSPVKSPARQVVEPISPDTGWCVSTDNVNHNDDPMMQQMQIINNYIAQAKKDHKYDEVKILESNLEDLKLEYSRQKGPSS